MNDYEFFFAFIVRKFFDPGRDKVVAPIVRFENVDRIAEPSAVLVSLDEFPTLFTRYRISMLYVQLIYIYAENYYFSSLASYAAFLFPIFPSPL